MLYYKTKRAASSRLKSSSANSIPGTHTHVYTYMIYILPQKVRNPDLFLLVLDRDAVLKMFPIYLPGPPLSSPSGIHIKASSNIRSRGMQKIPPPIFDKDYYLASSFACLTAVGFFRSFFISRCNHPPSVCAASRLDFSAT